MNKNKKLSRIILSVILITFMSAASGCNLKNTGREEIVIGKQRITLLNTKASSQTPKGILSKDFSVEKIDKYEGVRGEDWITNDTILITKENLMLKPSKIFDQMSNIRNMYSYTLKSGKEKNIYNTDYMWRPIISPNKKYIFSENVHGGKYSGLIMDMTGTVKVKIDDTLEKGYHLSYNNGKWVDNEEIIIPSGKGICLINVNSKITKIEELGPLQTDYAVKVGEKIYFISVKRQLISYDINTKQRLLIKNNVLNFELSPRKDMFAIEEKLKDGNDKLVIIDLKGKERKAIANGKMIFGISWSPDEKKLAYISTNVEESKSGLYIVELENSNSIYVSTDFVSVDNGLKWSPSSRKILASITEVKNMKAIDNTYIITLQ